MSSEVVDSIRAAADILEQIPQSVARVYRDLDGHTMPEVIHLLRDEANRLEEAK